MNIFFDFDGTITDIAPRHYSVYVQCVAKMNGAPLDMDEYWRLKRSDVKWYKILPMSGIDPSLEKEFLSFFINLIEDMDMLVTDKLFSGSIEVLDRLSLDNTLILVSLRRSHVNLTKQLKLLGIDKYFTKILSGHSDTREGVLQKKAEAIRGAGEYNTGVIVGDTEADVAAAKQLNFYSIAVTTGIRDHVFLREQDPDFIVDSLKDAQGIIEKL